MAAIDPPRVLVVDDDPSARGFFARLLAIADYEVVAAASAIEAKQRLNGGRFDVILSDITMPEMSGIELLQSVRERDLDVPVILVTGNPNVDTAAKAVQFGALRYLMKPVEAETLLESVKYAVQISQLARVKRQLLDRMGHGGSSDLAALQGDFERALTHVWMAFQPIVSHRRREIYAYEALMRSDDAKLTHVGALLDAAERLQRLPDLGRIVRRQVASTIDRTPGAMNFFVGDDALYDRRSPLARHAQRVVLEVTERAHLDGMTDLDARLSELRKLGYRIALDDLGAGYAGLNSFIRLKPDVIKIDMELVRGIDTDVTRQELVRSVHALCRTLAIAVVAEGIESKPEHAALAGIGIDLFQGFAFARPARELCEVPDAHYDGAAA
jgi:EAL domain-containing protein (putative c-di-GMP-specific phosphodiesterase class I)/CheY-like chemotaxis protein